MHSQAYTLIARIMAAILILILKARMLYVSEHISKCVLNLIQNTTVFYFIKCIVAKPKDILYKFGGKQADNSGDISFLVKISHI